MKTRILWKSILTAGLLVSTSGCLDLSEEPAPEDRPHIEGTAEDRRILRIEGIRNPDSPAGQARLYQLKRDREALEKILKEAENANMR